jgi:hypothetical protein
MVDLPANSGCGEGNGVASSRTEIVQLVTDRFPGASFIMAAL